MIDIHIEFSKYQGCGNDFIILDGRKNDWRSLLSQKHIAALCKRNFGIGADGLIIIEQGIQDHFGMYYYNADGAPGSFCGNGSRCSVLFAKHKLDIPDEGTFYAFDGIHQYRFISADRIQIEMHDVHKIEVKNQDCILNTGSPHYVKWVDDIKDIDAVEAGRKIRYSAPFKAKGINVNFCQIDKNKISMRTYERGVEDETLACGTGVTAAALCANYVLKIGSPISVQTRGGSLSVKFKYEEGEGFSQIWLEGSARKVFEGTYFFR